MTNLLSPDVFLCSKCTRTCFQPELQITTSLGSETSDGNKDSKDKFMHSLNNVTLESKKR